MIYFQTTARAQNIEQNKVTPRPLISRVLKKFLDIPWESNMLFDLVTYLRGKLKKGKLASWVEEDFLRLSTMAQKTNKRFKLDWNDQFPCFDDINSTPGYGEYFYHLGWAARKLVSLNPEVHYDISSHSYFVSVLSAVIPIKYYEFRHTPVALKGLETNNADLCHLPFEDGSILSLSCMHTIEHIGLGRYGDPLDYDGDLKALNELKRVVAVNGDLLLVVPVGTPARIQFNAHRIYNVKNIIDSFRPAYSIKEFSVVFIDENGICSLQENVELDSVSNSPYALACFHFHRDLG